MKNPRFAKPFREFFVTAPSSSLFSHVPPYEGDPILSLMEDFQSDPRPNKVSLSIGVYFDAEGRLPLLPSVRRAETALLQDIGPRPYLPIEGMADYRSAVQRLLFGAGHEAVASGRIATLQTLGGSGGLKVAQQATGTVILGGNSMGGATAMLQAAVEPDSVGGLVLTGSVYPWARGGWPHPLVITGFAAYDIPAVGDRVVEARLRHLSAERLVRMGYRMCTADPSTIPPEVTEASAALIEERAKDPDVGSAFLDAWRSMRRLGKRPDISKRAMDAIACPVLVMHGRRDRLVPVAFAEAALRTHPAWRGRIFPDLGHLPQMETPGRWLAEVADWYAEALD